MGGFPAQTSLSVFWPWSSPKILYKIKKSASFYPSKIVYKNNSISRRLSNTRENFGGNNLKQGQCDLPVIESRICYKLKEISSSPNLDSMIFGDDNRLGGDDSVPPSGESRVDFQKVSGYIVNAGGVNKIQALQINILKLRATKFVLFTSCRYKKDLAVHVKMDNQAALAYLVKIEGTRNLLMIQEAKEI